MATLIEKLKNKQLEARKNKDKDKTSLFTFLLGEIQRSAKKIEKDEEVVALFKSYIKSQRNEIEKKPYTGMEKDLALLDYVEKEFVLLGKKQLSEKEIFDLVNSLDSKSVKVVMPFLNKYEKDNNVIIDKAYAKTLTVKD